MSKIFASALLALILLLSFSPLAIAQSEGILPECDPTDTNLADGQDGCGKDDFADLIKNVIKWAERIIIPIAVAVVGWQAFVIMSSSGNVEKVKHATSMIWVAVIGIAILLLSHLAIQLIFSALGVGEEFLPGGIEKLNENTI